MNLKKTIKFFFNKKASIVVPYNNHYFVKCNERKNELLKKETLFMLNEYEIIEKFENNNNIIQIARVKPFTDSDSDTVLVVLKTSKDILNCTKEDINILKNEAKFLLDIEEYSILRIISIFSNYSREFDSTIPYLVIPYCEGGTLDDLYSYLKDEDIIFYLLQLSKVIADLHKKNIIHKDIKPSNVLFQKDLNNKFKLMVSDFGIAMFENSSKIIDAATIAYSSPEQLMNNNITVNTDVWSWGIVAWDYLNKEHPFQKSIDKYLHNQNIELYVKSIEKTKLKNKPKNKNFPMWLYKIVKRCLSFNANDRPSMEEVLSSYSNHCLITTKDLSYKLGNIDSQYSFQVDDIFFLKELNERYNWSVHNNSWEIFDVSTQTIFNIHKANQLFKLGEADGQREAIELIDNTIGKWNEEKTLLNELFNNPNLENFNNDTISNSSSIALEKINRDLLELAIDIKCSCLISRIEDEAKAEDIEILKNHTINWNNISLNYYLNGSASSDSIINLCHLAQALLLIGDIELSLNVVSYLVPVSENNLLVLKTCALTLYYANYYDTSLECYMNAINLCNENTMYSNFADEFEIEVILLLLEIKQNEKALQFVESLNNKQSYILTILFDIILIRNNYHPQNKNWSQYKDLLKRTRINIPLMIPFIIEIIEFFDDKSFLNDYIKLQLGSKNINLPINLDIKNYLEEYYESLINE